MNFLQDQAVLWTKWDGMTALAADHMDYSCFDHSGASGGSNATDFTPRSESYLFGIRMGWWRASPSDHVVYEPFTQTFAATLTIEHANELPN
jgi:hypothetical protein